MATSATLRADTPSAAKPQLHYEAAMAALVMGAVAALISRGKRASFNGNQRRGWTIC